MNETSTDTESDPIREQYDEYTTENGVVAIITDPENERAWIESTLTYDIKQ